MQYAHQFEQALLKVVIVLAGIAHELCNGALALAKLAQVEGAQLVQLPAALQHKPRQMCFNPNALVCSLHQQPAMKYVRTQCRYRQALGRT